MGIVGREDKGVAGGRAGAITRTAALTALLVAAQMLTAPLGNTIVTGTVVNMLLAVSAVVGGLPAGVAVAALSPVLAKLLGIGPLWGLIPFIAAGNMTLVLAWHLLGGRRAEASLWAYLPAVAGAAAAKSAILYLGVVRLAIPLLLGLSGPEATAVSALFSLPQLLTALLGGTLAAALLPAVQRALSQRR